MMKKASTNPSTILTLVFLITFSVAAESQDHLRAIKPAFPIGAGEEMLIYTGRQIAGLSPFDFNSTTGETNGSFSNAEVDGATGFTKARFDVFKIDLPVGTTMKRFLGEFADTTTGGGVPMFIKMIRIRTSDPTDVIEMREISTWTVISDNVTDYQQVVSNPMNHVMLQGWFYAILVDWPGGTDPNSHAINLIKLIYEP